MPSVDRQIRLGNLHLAGLADCIAEVGPPVPPGSLRVDRGAKKVGWRGVPSRGHDFTTDLLALGVQQEAAGRGLQAQEFLTSQGKIDAGSKALGYCLERCGING